VSVLKEAKSNWKFSSGERNQFLVSPCATDVVVQGSACPGTSLRAFRFWLVHTLAPPISWRQALCHGNHWSKPLGWYLCWMKYFERCNVKAVSVFWLWGKKTHHHQTRIPLPCMKKWDTRKNNMFFQKCQIRSFLW